MSKTPQKCTSIPWGTPKREYAFYVVWKGRNLGIYSSWDQCETQVSAYKNNCYKGYYTFEVAEAAYYSKPYSNFQDEASEGSSNMCPNCVLLNLEVKLLQAQVGYISEKHTTPSPSKGKLVSGHLGELSDMLKKKVMLDHR